MSKKILVVLSEWGYWGEELVGPLEAFEEAGYSVDFMTPDRQAPGRDRREHGSRLRRPAARPLGHLARRWARRSPALRHGRQEQRARQPDEPLRADAGAPVPQRGRLPAQGRGLLQGARREGEGLRRHLRRDADRRRLRADRRPRQQPAPARPDPRLLRRRQADRRRVLRRHVPRVRPQLGGPQEHHLRQARHGPLHRVRLQVRHRLHGHELRDGPAAVPARVDPARRDRSRRRLPRQLRPRDVRDRRLPVRDRAAPRPTRTSPGQKMVEVLETGLKQWGFHPSAVGAAT